MPSINTTISLELLPALAQGVMIGGIPGTVAGTSLFIGARLTAIALERFLQLSSATKANLSSFSKRCSSLNVCVLAVCTALHAQKAFGLITHLPMGVSVLGVAASVALFALKYYFLKKQNQQPAHSAHTTVPRARLIDISKVNFVDVSKTCEQWMDNLSSRFDFKGKKTYTFDQLYAQDVEHSPEELDAMNLVYRTVWGPKGIAWTEKFPSGWSVYDKSNRSSIIEHPDHPGFLFKICAGSPGKGLPGAHFLRVPKGKEMARIVRQEKLDEIDIVKESLIPLKSKEEIRKINENNQCYEFVVKSEKLPLLSEKETLQHLSSYDEARQIKIATQLVQLLIESGVGDIGPHNLRINKQTGKLVVIDTEPLFESMYLEEEEQAPSQYQNNNKYKHEDTNASAARSALYFSHSCFSGLPIFQKVIEIYRAQLEIKTGSNHVNSFRW